MIHLPLIEKFLSFQSTPTTRRVNGSDLADWHRFLDSKGRSITEATEEDALAWRTTLEERHLAASTVARKLSAGRKFHLFLAERGFTSGTRNPFDRIPHPRVDQLEGKTPSPSKKEVERLLRAMDPRTHRGLRDRVIGFLLFNQGLRVSEVARLKRTDVQTIGNASVVTVLAKGGFRHRTFLSPKISSLLARHIRRTVGDGEHLFFGMPSGRPPVRAPQKPMSPRSIHSNLKGYARAAALDPAKIRPHSGRVFFITEAYLKTHDIELVSRAVGHRNVTTTRRYLRLPVDLARKATWSVRLRV